MMKENNHNNLNKTFARRVARKLTDINQRALSEVLPGCLFSQERLLTSKFDKKYLEIGFGMGEHFIHQVTHNPSSLYIGAEVFINGVANVLKQLNHERDKSVLIWPDDIDLIIPQIPSASLDGIYILFPDPWHKRRYLKKRLLNSERLDSFKDKLKKEGFISFASDIEDYFLYVKQLFIESGTFTLEDKDFSLPHLSYIETKYHKKAIRGGRIPQFITAMIKKKGS